MKRAIRELFSYRRKFHPLKAFLLKRESRGSIGKKIPAQAGMGKGPVFVFLTEML